MCVYTRFLCVNIPTDACAENEGSVRDSGRHAFRRRFFDGHPLRGYEMPHVGAQHNALLDGVGEVGMEAQIRTNHRLREGKHFEGVP